MKNIIEELSWRGMLHNHTEGIETLLNNKSVTAYWGCDPTSDSLHIGNLAAGMLLVHLHRAGHNPILLVGGATGLIGDPSGRNDERELLSIDQLEHNLIGIRKSMENIFEFANNNNPPVYVNNYDFYKNMSVFDFLRNIGKHFSVNTMLAKDSVKNRLENGISFTEFSYQLVQGYDFYYLHKYHNCQLQVGGSDQWGNMLGGTDLIRRMGGSDAHVITCPLLVKADGTKFGKSMGGNIWLNADKTSAYQFYQHWINSSDDDVKTLIRRFTFISKAEINELEQLHDNAPHLRILQKRLAKEVTTMVHSHSDYEVALRSSELLFSDGNKEQLLQFNEKQLLDIFEGLPTYKISKTAIEATINLTDLLADKTKVYPSKGELRKNINSLYLNKEKTADLNYLVNSDDLLLGKYLVIQKGKKNYNLIIAE